MRLIIPLAPSQLNKMSITTKHKHLPVVLAFEVVIQTMAQGTYYVTIISESMVLVLLRFYEVVIFNVIFQEL